jgi:hypothetical protein
VTLLGHAPRLLLAVKSASELRYSGRAERNSVPDPFSPRLDVLPPCRRLLYAEFTAEVVTEFLLLSFKEKNDA